MGGRNGAGTSPCASCSANEERSGSQAKVQDLLPPHQAYPPHPPRPVYTPHPHQENTTHIATEHAVVLSRFRPHTPKSTTVRPPPPTFSELRALARASRKKSPGPDGVPPYLLHILPDPVFKLVHSCISLCYSEGFLPQPWLVSETFCLFKGKGQWQDPIGGDQLP